MEYSLSASTEICQIWQSFPQLVNGITHRLTQSAEMDIGRTPHFIADTWKQNKRTAQLLKPTGTNQ